MQAPVVGANELRAKMIFRDLLSALQTELRLLASFNASDRKWQMPFAAALASGLPLLVGAWFDHLGYGLVSCLGGLVFLYLPNTPLHHRMVWLMACAFSMVSCYALGVIGQLLAPVLPLVIGGIAMVVTMVCRYYGLGPPGSVFFVMAAAIGAYSQIGVQEVPLRVGLLAMGCLLAYLIAFAYSLYILRLVKPGPVPQLPPASFDFVVFDSVIIGAFVALSLVVAQLLQMERAYWVPVSCIAVVQGASLRAVWTRQIHRIAGTAVGMLLAWGLLALPLDKWSIAGLMMVMSFIIEVLVVRHYGLAVVFITPLTILLAEAATLGHGSPDEIVLARFFDTVLGCVVGLACGVCIHNERFREVVGRWVRGMIPQRLLP